MLKRCLFRLKRLLLELLRNPGVLDGGVRFSCGERILAVGILALFWLELAAPMASVGTANLVPEG